MSRQKARELRQERADVAKKAQAMITDNPDGFDADTTVSWKKHMARVDHLMDAKFEEDGFDGITELESRADRMDAANETLGAKQDYLSTTKEFGAKEENAEEQKALWTAGLRRHMLGEIDAAEFRALATQTKGTAGIGGNTVPADMEASVITGLKAFGGMRAVSRIISTENGRNLDFPTSDDTGNVATIVAEATAITASTAVPFGKITMEAIKYKSGPIKIARELIQDSVIDPEAYVTGRMIERFGRGTNAHYTTRSSTESSGPHGIVNDSTGAVAVVNNALTPENLLTLMHSIDPAYRIGPSVAWMTADAGVNEVRALRWATSGQFVWEPSIQPGTPDRLLGWPIVVNQDVPLEGTSANKWLWFGNWSHYAIRDVQGIDMMVLQERYAEEDVIAVLGYMRTDGRRLTGSTVVAQAPYKAIIQSTG